MSRLHLYKNIYATRMMQHLQLQTIVVIVLIGINVLLGGVVLGPHEGEHAEDHPSEDGIVDAEGLAGAVTVEALINQGEGGVGDDGGGSGGDGSGNLVHLLLSLGLAHHAGGGASGLDGGAAHNRAGEGHALQGGGGAHSLHFVSRGRRCVKLTTTRKGTGPH